MIQLQNTSVTFYPTVHNKQQTAFEIQTPNEATEDEVNSWPDNVYFSLLHCSSSYHLIPKCNICSLPLAKTNLLPNEYTWLPTLAKISQENFDRCIPCQAAGSQTHQRPLHFVHTIKTLYDRLSLILINRE